MVTGVATATMVTTAADTASTAAMPAGVATAAGVTTPVGAAGVATVAGVAAVGRQVVVGGGFTPSNGVGSLPNSHKEVVAQAGFGERCRGWVGSGSTLDAVHAGISSLATFSGLPIGFGMPGPRSMIRSSAWSPRALAVSTGGSEAGR
jgi:hypothetical protein